MRNEFYEIRKRLEAYYSDKGFEGKELRKLVKCQLIIALFERQQFPESFSTASDHIAERSKKVVGGDGEVKLRHSASALPVGGRVGAGATAWGCGLFRFAPRWMASVAGAWGRGRCAPGFNSWEL